MSKIQTISRLANHAAGWVILSMMLPAMLYGQASIGVLRLVGDGAAVTNKESDIPHAVTPGGLLTEHADPSAPAQGAKKS